MSKKRSRKTKPAKPPAAPPPSAPAVPPPDVPLSAKQLLFVQEYPLDCNAKQAAIRAGYSEKTAEQQGSRLLRNVKVSTLVAEALAKRAERTEVTADRVVLELARVGFSNLKAMFKDGRLLKLEDVGEEVSPAIASIKVITKNKGEGEVEYVAEVRAWDKVAALRALMPHVGLNTEKSQSDVNMKLPQLAQIEADVRKMDTETLRAYDELTRQQEALLAKAKGVSA